LKSSKITGKPQKAADSVEKMLDDRWNVSKMPNIQALHVDVNFEMSARNPVRNSSSSVKTDHEVNESIISNTSISFTWNCGEFAKYISAPGGVSFA
jgi:hypothetical protein